MEHVNRNGEQCDIMSMEEAVKFEMPVWRLAPETATGKMALLFLCGRFERAVELDPDTSEDDLPRVACQECFHCPDERLLCCWDSAGVFFGETEPKD